MKISVVVPAYNEETLLPRLLQSLQNQDFPKKDYEVIVVDNNSTDNTASLARKFGARVVTEKKRGVPYARDTGTKMAKGKIILSTDADCIFPDNFLSRINMAFNSNEKIYGICGSIFMPDAPFAVRLSEKIASPLSHLYTHIIGNSPVCWAPNFSFRKDMFEKIGGYKLDRPLLRLGINADGSDEYAVVERFVKIGGKVIFDKNLRIIASGRRFNKRLLYWLVVEHLIGFTLNKRLYSAFGVVIPTPSYFKRVTPKKFYGYFMLALFLSTLSIVAPLTYIKYSAPQAMTATELQLKETAQKEIKKVLAMSEELLFIQKRFNLQEKIAPYLKHTLIQ